MRPMLFSFAKDPDTATPAEHLAAELRSLEHRYRRPHELLILSCYIQKEPLLRLIHQLANEVRLTNVHVLFDVGEAVKRGFREIQNEFRGIAISLSRREPGVSLAWSAVRTPGGLMHGKGYGIIQYDGRREIVGGRLLLGSPNATGRGLGFAPSPNVELGAVTNDVGAIQEFRDAYMGLAETCRYDLRRGIDEEDVQLFRYAVLANGVYLIPWSGSVRSLFTIPFRLTEKGAKEALIPDRELKKRGLAAARGALSKQYLSLPPDLERKDYPQTFARNCTIETGLGRFCPEPIWRVVVECRNERIHSVMNAVQACLSERALEEAVRVAEEDLGFLAAKGWCVSDPWMLLRWTERMEALRENPDRIFRILSQFNVVELPYDRTDFGDIDMLFASLQGSLDMSLRQNMAQRLVSETLEEGSVEDLPLSKSEGDLIRTMFRDF